MTEVKKQTRSLRVQVLEAALLALAAGALLFLALTRLGGFLIQERYMSPENVNRRKAQIFSEFSSFVTSQGAGPRRTTM